MIEKSTITKWHSKTRFEAVTVHLHCAPTSSPHGCVQSMTRHQEPEGWAKTTTKKTRLKQHLIHIFTHIFITSTERIADHSRPQKQECLEWSSLQKWFNQDDRDRSVLVESRAARVYQHHSGGRRDWQRCLAYNITTFQPISTHFNPLQPTSTHFTHNETIPRAELNGRCWLMLKWLKYTYVPFPSLFPFSKIVSLSTLRLLKGLVENSPLKIEKKEEEKTRPTLQVRRIKKQLQHFLRGCRMFST